MDKSYIERNIVVDRYLRGSLSAEELDEFEERLLWDRKLIEDVEFSEALQKSMRESASRDRFRVPAPGFFERFADFLAVPRYAAAASFTLALFVASGVALNVEFSSGPDSASPFVQVRELDLLRGSEPWPVAFDRDAQLVLVITLDEESRGRYSSFHVSLSNADPESGEIWRQSGLSATAGGVLPVVMPGDILKAGNHLLTVAGATTGAAGSQQLETVQTFPFRAIPAPD